MKLFKKEDPSDYKVKVYVPNVDSMQLQMTLICKVKRDEEDRLLYLVDKDTNGKRFKELFPGDNKKTYIKEDLPEIENKYKKLKEKSKIPNKTSTENYLNIEKEIYELEFLINKYKEEKGTFVYLDSKGLKCLSYLRKSTGLHPLHYNINSNNVFQPIETDSRDAFLTWKSKYESLQDKKDKGIKTLITIFGIFVGALILFGLGYGSYKLTTYNQRADDALIQQKYLCNEIYQKGIADIIATNKKTSDILNDKINNISIDTEISGVTSVTDTIKKTAEILS